MKADAAWLDVMGDSLAEMSALESMWAKDDREEIQALLAHQGMLGEKLRAVDTGLPGASGLAAAREAYKFIANLKANAERLNMLGIPPASRWEAHVGAFDGALEAMKGAIHELIEEESKKRYERLAALKAETTRLKK